VVIGAVAPGVVHGAVDSCGTQRKEGDVGFVGASPPGKNCAYDYDNKT
jgi:hypothetical protein